MKADQERVSKLLTDTVTLLCKNGLIYKDEIKIQGLLGITLDRNDVFIVHINETIGNGTSKDSSSDGTGKKGPTPGVPVVDLTRVADTPVIPAQLRGMGALVPGMSQPITGAGGGMGARKQRPLMPQMMPRGQYMPVPRFRMGMPPASMQAMASQMNNHMIYSRQPGNLPGMPHVRHRMPMPLSHLATPSRRQQMQPSATVSIDDDEDVVIIGTGHEEPSPNWNSPVRRNQQGRSNSQQPQLSSAGQVKLAPSISLSSTVPGSSASSSGLLADVDQLPVAVTLNENMLEEQTELEISLNEAAKDSNDQPKLIQIMGENGDPLTVSGEIASLASAMLIEPNDQDSDGDNNHTSTDLKGQSDNLQLSDLATTTEDCSMNNKSPLQVHSDATVDPDLPSEVQLSLEDPEKTKTTYSDKIPLQNSPKMTLTQHDQPVSTSGKIMLPVVYTDVADDPEPLQFDGAQVTDMDIQTLSFDILTEDDQDVAHSSSQLSPWICKLSGCNASYTEASDLATHYTVRHTGLLDMLPASYSLPLANDSSTSEGSERGSSDGSGRRKHVKVMHCPFTGCQNKFSSWPGLNLHHKKVHGAPLSRKERMEIVELYGKPFKCTIVPSCQKSYMTKRELSRHVIKMHENPEGSDSNVSIPYLGAGNNAGAPSSADAGSPVDAETASSVAKNFLCLNSQCEVVCSSREALVEHLQTCHGSVVGADKSSSTNIKEETIEGQ